MTTRKSRRSPWSSRTKRYVLVYQAGIANVFQVKSFNLSDYGRDAERLLQADFRACENFAKGLAAAGGVVRTAACNIAGDCAHAQWTEDLESQPFFDKFQPVHKNPRRNPDQLAFGNVSGSHQNTGTFIDGAFGEDHAVEVMKGLLQRVLRVAADADAQKLLDEVESVNDLDAEQTGEWLEDATNVLQNHTGGGLVWMWEAGDLVLMDEAEAE